ncbi:MAG: ABC-F family ATP-binding cassette domain-containing protein [Clostridia bacterium]|nr:ABC-F family ATP-binding cassette domain-containing protein [Clostridia bacterium]MBR6108761.1 ABC-F family ATP-binding cassette domain-containing protein [Clostridia bacterium]
MALLSVNGLKKSYVTRVLFEDISFEVEPGDHIGFIGVNGCGKSTLFAILEGRESYDEGMISIGRDTRLGSMEQTLDTRGVSLYTYVEGIFGELISIESELDSINERIQHEGATDALIERQSRLRERFEDEGGLTFRARTRSTLLGLGFTEEELSKDIALFSGGQRNKAQLARLLLSRANLLLLDEPTNHLDIKAIEWLEDFLSAYKGAFIVISHDRYFLDKVANRMIEMKDLRLYKSKGNYSRHMELRSTARELEMRRYLRAMKEIRRIEGMVEQQRRWGQQHNFVTAFHKQKAADRIKETLVEPERDPASMHFKFTAKEGGGNDAVIIKGLAKSFGAKQVFANADMLVKRGEKVFILGDNGCGKTTLLNIIAGRLRPSAGSCMLGAHIEAAYYEQTMASLDPDKTVLNEVWDKYFNTISYKDIRNALGAFLFRGDEVEKKIGLLSGGEKARVQLLKLMLTRANLLLLDEPTNHLDIASREALENALDEYNGTMVIVTHDRYLVNRLADRIFLMTPSGLREFIGGYDDCLEAMKAGDETAAEEKKLSANAVEYRERKQLQSDINKAKTAVSRAEKRIQEAEAELDGINARLASPAYSSDYVKAGELSKKADEIRKNIDELYAQWEEAEAKLASLGSEKADNEY